jgi:aspartate racemase
MKTIGLLGGMSWESTAVYYRLINEGVKAHLGGLHSAKLVLYSVDFQEIEELQHAADWDEAGKVLAKAAHFLQLAGADFLVICTNTMHKVAPAIEREINIPILHIADATAAVIKGLGIRTVGLLGTRFTMEQDFYTGRLREKHGLQVLIPDENERERVHQIIYNELCLGKVLNESRGKYCHIIRSLAQGGAEGIILGCTEIAMLIGQKDSPVPLFDTTRIHAQKAVDWAIEGVHPNTDSSNR